MCFFFYVIELCSLTLIRIQIGLKISCVQDGNNFQLLCMDNVHIFLFYSNLILAGLVVFFFCAAYTSYIYIYTLPSNAKTRVTIRVDKNDKCPYKS